jgi:hypothetical protein
MIFEYSVGVDEIEDDATHRATAVRFRAHKLSACGDASPPAWSCRTHRSTSTASQRPALGGTTPYRTGLNRVLDLEAFSVRACGGVAEIEDKRQLTAQIGGTAFGTA